MSNSGLAEVEHGLTEFKPEISLSGNRLKPKLVVIDSPLFVDCLLEPAAWQNRQRRWTAVLSMALQAVGLGILVLIPLMFRDVLPPQQLVTLLVATPPPPPPPLPPPTAAAPVKPIIGEVVSGRLIAPTKIPESIRMIRENEAPPALTGFGVPGGVPGGIAGGQLGGVLGGIINSTATHSVVSPPIAPPKRLRISEGVSAGQLINRVQPEYPKIAKDARIQGTVQLTAWITKDGSIERLTVVKGHPMLINAAVVAVNQWRWRPFKLNGEPIEVETSVTVVFSMSNANP